jgi:4-hydroxybenzoate polyprenyltransferase
MVLSMIRAFIEVFPNAVLLSGAQTNLLLIGTAGPTNQIDPNRVADALSNAPAVQADLQRLDLGTVREIVGTFGTCAMAFNRIVDREFDRSNPRTAARHLPTGQIALSSAWTLCILSGAGLIVSSYFINWICFLLSPIALFIVCFYSLTKRFTDFTHFYLGIALALAPIGAWLAVRSSLSLEPFLLALAVVGWLVGFDIIYSIQDYEFDRRHGLHSLVVRWGVDNALKCSFLSHMIMWGLLVLFGLLSGFRLAYLVGLLIIFASLFLEHWIARKRSLKWINTAFFRLNALISIIFFVVTVVEVAFPAFSLLK